MQNKVVESFNGRMRDELFRCWAADAPSCRMDRDAGLGCNRGMNDPLIVQTLKQERAEILGQINGCETRIAHAEHDLAHLDAPIDLFAAPERQAGALHREPRVLQEGRDRRDWRRTSGMAPK